MILKMQWGHHLDLHSAYTGKDPTIRQVIDKLNDEHMKIVDFINQIGEAIQREDIPEIEMVFTGLMEYTISHFESEEKLMEQGDYPILEGHKQAHRDFGERITKIYKSFQDAKGGGFDNCKKQCRELYSSLTLWLENHIMKEDKGYVKYIPSSKKSAGDFLKMEIRLPSWLKK